MDISPTIPKIQFTDHMKPKKKEDQNVDASVLLRRVNKILTRGKMKSKCGCYLEGGTKQSRKVEGGRGLGGTEEGKGKMKGRIRYGRRWRTCTEGQETEQMCVTMVKGELEVATRKSQMPESKTLPGPHGDVIS